MDAASKAVGVNLGSISWSIPKMKWILDVLKIWLPSVTATILSMLLLYLAKDLPCAIGAGAAMSGFEELILLILVALPCFLWALARLLFRRILSKNLSWEEKWIDRLAIVTIVGIVIYAGLVIPTFFSYPHPLQIVCKQSYLRFLFEYPIMPNK